jgi:hypothetical protein
VSLRLPAFIFLLILTGIARAEGPADKSGLASHGAQLAHIYCSACHLFPEPQLLDKKTWVQGALRKMAPLIGAGHVDLSRRPDGKLLKEANVFPAAPLISEPDWIAIVDYYHENAPELPIPQAARRAIQIRTNLFEVDAIRYGSGPPETTMVKIDPRAKRLYLGNARDRTLDILNSRGEMIARVPVESGPTSLSVRPDGLYVTLIGHVFPSDERDGKLVRIKESKEHRGQFAVETLIRDLPRTVWASFADLNGDGREDIVISAFGNYLGRLSWFEQTGGGYKEHLLLNNPGALNSIVIDINKDGLPDIITLMAQAKEGVHLFTNQKNGNFSDTSVLQFHPLFGSTHIEVADMNGDGLPDLLITNGDNGEYPSPFKNYHGARIFLNNGHADFRESWFYPVNGAFKAVPTDLDGDGDLDIVLISFFPDMSRSPEESFIFFENKGGMNFEPISIPQASMGRWLTMDIGDLDGDGQADIVLGSFADGPASIAIPKQMREQWRTNGTVALHLRKLPGANLKASSAKVPNRE